MDRLPEELLADILGRLPPRPLAVCRSVCKDLRAAIDGRGLLLALAHRVPRGLAGMFICRSGNRIPCFFARRAAAPACPRIVVVDAELSFLPQLGWEGAVLVHQCNGLLLFQGWTATTQCELCVCNPATRRWEQLPPPPLPPPHEDGGDDEAAAYLVFDPTFSLHYEVFLFPQVPPTPKISVQRMLRRPRSMSGNYFIGSIRLELNLDELTPNEIRHLPSSVKADYDREVHTKGSMEWPSSSYVVQVFSSRTGQWEERTYHREDDVAVTLSDVWSDPCSSIYPPAPRCNAVRWRGALYVHCRGGFIMRLSLVEQKYQVIRTPRLDNVFIPPPRKEIDDLLGAERPYHNEQRSQSHQEYMDSLQPSMHLGKSEHGIYYTVVRWHRLQVWMLHEASESRPVPEWELKYKADIRPSFLQHYKQDGIKEIKTSWVLDHEQISRLEDREECGWDSSDDSGINVEEEYCGYSNDHNHNIKSSMDFLGYYPSKEIVFLGNRFDGFAYYLGSSKLQYLGTFEPVGHFFDLVTFPQESFIYTPCMDDLLSAHNIGTDQNMSGGCEYWQWEDEMNVSGEQRGRVAAPMSPVPLQAVAAPAPLHAVAAPPAAIQAAEAAPEAINQGRSNARVVDGRVDRVIQQLKWIEKLAFVCIFLALYAMMK